MHVFQEFPKWKYHATKDALIVENKESEEALGGDWADLPIVDDSGSESAVPAPAPKPSRKVKS